MANQRKRGFLSSLFRNKRQSEQEEIAQQESKRRLEERIQQFLAEKAAVREILAEESQAEAALMILKVEAEPDIELLPISASVISIRKAPVPSSWVPSLEVPRSYATNER